MGDPPAGSQRPSSPRRQAEMKGSRVNSRNPSDGNAAGKLEDQGTRSGSFSEVQGPPIGTIQHRAAGRGPDRCDCTIGLGLGARAHGRKTFVRACPAGNRLRVLVRLRINSSLTRSQVCPRILDGRFRVLRV